MKVDQKGFTLIELVVVIVILGILAATALPKFVDISKDAYDAQAKAVGGSLNSWSAINYAKYKAAGGTATGATQVNSSTLCTTVGGALSTYVTLSGITAADLTVAPKAPAVACADGATTACTIVHAKGNATLIDFTMVCTG